MKSIKSIVISFAAAWLIILFEITKVFADLKIGGGYDGIDRNKVLITGGTHALHYTNAELHHVSPELKAAHHKAQVSSPA